MNRISVGGGRYVVGSVVLLKQQDEFNALVDILIVNLQPVSAPSLPGYRAWLKITLVKTTKSR